MEEALLEKPYVEYLDGKAYPKNVSPKTRHSIVQGAVLRILHRCSTGIDIAGIEWDFRVGIVDGTQTMFVPEAERDQPPFAPDVAVEVRSPSFRSPIAREKIVRYLRTGAALVLDVDPRKRTVVAHSRDDVRTFHEGECFAHEAAPWLVFDVAELFSDLDLLSG